MRRNGTFSGKVVVVVDQRSSARRGPRQDRRPNVTDRIRVVVAAPVPDAGDGGPGGEVDGRADGPVDGPVTRVTRSLRDAGMEVIYTGLHQSPEQIVATALQEDVDAIGLVVRSDDHGGHLTVFPTVLRLLAELDAEDVVVFGVGVPGADIGSLEELRVAKVFTPEALSAEIATWLRKTVVSSEAAQT
jgi:methylmalonyl-CoA mutase C-terminal domain/subunit